MTAQELLDELSGGILRDRSSQIGGPDDSLWSDESLLRYINEAETRLTTIGLVLHDATTTAVTQVPLSEGVAQYTLHPSIIAVISARYSGDPFDLSRAGHDALFAFSRPDTAFFDPAVAPNLPPGKPLAWTTDEQLDAKSGISGVVSLRVYPTPSANYLGPLQLRVIRRPLKPLSLDEPDRGPEVPEQYHLGLLDWAAYRALRNIDTDVAEMSKADRFRQTFDEMVSLARRDTLRKLFAPARYSFGLAGWSWER